MTKKDQLSSLAVAISLYDRWDEAQGLLELLRLNWQTGPGLYIAVTSTAPEDQMPSWVNRSLADKLLFGSSYALPARRGSVLRPLHDRRYGVFKTKLRARTLDCISRGCAQAADTSCDYTLHLHAAAWPLKEKVIYDIVDRMRQNNYLFAARGYGKNYLDGKHPAGDIDDNFFFIDNRFARHVDFWNFNPAEDADRIGNEGRLARRVYQVCRDEQVYYYENFSRADDFVFPAAADQRRVQPYNYHKPTGMLRSHDMHWQARLCARFGYHGPFLDLLVARELPTATARQSMNKK